MLPKKQTTKATFSQTCSLRLLLDENRNNKASYLGAHAGLSLVVLLVGHPFVQLTPQSFRLPGGDPLFQTVVESAAVGRVQVQLSAEDVEGLEGFLAGRRLDKVLKEFPHIVPLLLRLSHLLLLRRAVSTHWGSLSVRCGYTLGSVGNAMPSLSWEGWLRRKGGWGGCRRVMSSHSWQSVFSIY